jgi:hypothetical protein
MVGFCDFKEFGFEMQVGKTEFWPADSSCVIALFITRNCFVFFPLNLDAAEYIYYAMGCVKEIEATIQSHRLLMLIVMMRA